MPISLNVAAAINGIFEATGTNIVLLEPDVAQAFPTARAVNQALRELLSERHA